MDRVASALLSAADRGLIPRGESVLLAVSGGADSMALLYGSLETVAATAWRLTVAHVHHGWRGRSADRDLSFVRDHARRLGLPCFWRRCDARRAASELRLSPEAAARHLRYACLCEMAAEAGASRIATAHQQDDVIESYLLARERNGGIAALAGPRESREDGVVRPMLSVSRTEILDFLAARGVGFRRDASNGDLRLARNRIRRRQRELGPDSDPPSELLGDVARLADRRRWLDEEYAARVVPALHVLPGSTLAEAFRLERCSEELLRLSLERLAERFARPGRPPLTGRERERLRGLVAGGGDFRFEAGRRIRFERRGGILSVRPSDSARRLAPV